MKKFIIGGAIVVLVIIGAVYIGSRAKAPTDGTTPPPPGTGTTITIEMGADAFTPNKITIKKNGTVVFKNVDTKAHWPASNIHPTHLIYPEFDPKGGVPAGESWSFTFTKAGIWRMHDHLYPDIVGTITVTE